MNISEKFWIASQIYSESGFRALVLSGALRYGGSVVQNQYLRSCGFERCTTEKDIAMIYLPVSDVEYIDRFDFIPQRGKDAVAGEAKGSWDRLRQPFEDSRVYRSLRDVYVNGSDWNQTALYKTARRRIQSGKKAWRCNSVDELEERISQIQNLYKSCRNSGFESQLSLYRTEGNDKRDYQTRLGDVLVPDELCIAIGRNGEIIRTTNGHHRVSIMKVLDKNTYIPAIVQFKHASYEENLPYKKVCLNDAHDLVEYSPV